MVEAKIIRDSQQSLKIMIINLHELSFCSSNTGLTLALWPLHWVSSLSGTFHLLGCPLGHSDGHQRSSLIQMVIQILSFQSGFLEHPILDSTILPSSSRLSYPFPSLPSLHLSKPNRFSFHEAHLEYGRCFLCPMTISLIRFFDAIHKPKTPLEILLRLGVLCWSHTPFPSFFSGSSHLQARKAVLGESGENK